MRAKLGLLIAGGLSATLLLLAVAVPAYAAGLRDDRVVFGDDVTVGEGEVLQGDVVVFDGNATILKDATVTGSVLVFGGNADLSEGTVVENAVAVLGGNAHLAGRVEEDLIVAGGTARLEGTASVGGELVSLGGSVSRDPSAVVEGGVTERGPFPRIFIWRGFEFQVIGVVINAFVLAALALLVALFLPNHTARVAEAISRAPAMSGGMGLLTGVAAPILMVLMAITLCLIPLSVAGALVFAAALLMGWIGLGTLVGNRLGASFKWESLGPAGTAAVGTFLFTLVVQGLGLIPCLGWLVELAAWLVGLGAVVLTRFGRQAYLPTPTAPAPPAQPAPPAPLEGGEAPAT